MRLPTGRTRKRAMAQLIQTEHLDLLAMLVVAVFGGFALYRLIVWIRESPVSPNPWSPEVESSVHLPEADPICPKCFTPQPPGQWFCEHCNSAVGDYNNWMPYVREFSQGEVFRNGVTEKIRINTLTVFGYLILSLSAYLVFAPVYWYFFFKNVKRIRQEELQPAPPEGQG